MASQVLVADDDPVVRHLLRNALLQDGFEVETARDGLEAMRVLDSDTAPRLVLLDRVMPGADGLEVCRRLRAGDSGVDTHVFLMSGRQNPGDILEAFDAGSDEFIPKPFDLPTVVARMHAAARRQQSTPVRGGRGVRALLLEAASTASTGELVVRGRERIGRVVLHRGKVAWIHLGGGSGLLDLLTALGISERDARLALGECRTQGLPFLDTLVSWGLSDRATLEAAFRDELAARLATLLLLPASATFFVPLASPLRSGFLFDPVELLRDSSPPPAVGALAPARPVSVAPPPVPTGLERLLDDLTQIEGVAGVVVSDLPSGGFLASRGQPCGESRRREMARSFLVDAGETLEEALLASQTHYHLARVWSGLLICLRVDRRKNPNLALVRLSLSRCLESSA